mgnify:CR=1 FL=1
MKLKQYMKRIVVLAMLCVLGVVVLSLCSCGAPESMSGKWLQSADGGEKTLIVADSLDSWELIYPDGHKQTGALTNRETDGYMVMHGGQFQESSDGLHPEDQLWRDGAYLYYREGVQSPTNEWERTIGVRSALESRMGSGDSTDSNSVFAGIWHREGYVD